MEFLGTWEQIYNPDFKVVEFDHFKSEAGLHTFVLSVSEWIEKTNAKGLYVKKGRYGGTFAHKDIAFEFASAISPVFKLYLIKELYYSKWKLSGKFEMVTLVVTKMPATPPFLQHRFILNNLNKITIADFFSTEVVSKHNKQEYCNCKKANNQNRCFRNVF